MDNKTEALRLLKEANEDLERSERNFREGDWVASTHYAQLVIEKSTKAVISCFGSYKWTHDSSNEIKELIKKGLLPPKFVELADFAHDAGPWHGRATYGGIKDGKWMSPSYWCTEDMASRLIENAKKTVSKAQKFIENFFQDEV